MATGFSIDLRGDKELRRKLDQLSPRVERKVLAKVQRRALKRMRAAARAAAPVRTRALRRSIKTKIVKRRRRGVVALQVRTGTRSELGIPESATGYYPAALEYGWTDRGGNRHPARSFMRSAWHSTLPAMRRDVARGIREGIEAEAAK